MPLFQKSLAGREYKGDFIVVFYAHSCCLSAKRGQTVLEYWSLRSGRHLKRQCFFPCKNCITSPPSLFQIMNLPCEKCPHFLKKSLVKKFFRGVEVCEGRIMLIYTGYCFIYLSPPESFRALLAYNETKKCLFNIPKTATMSITIWFTCN